MKAKRVSKEELEKSFEIVEGVFFCKIRRELVKVHPMFGKLFNEKLKQGKSMEIYVMYHSQSRNKIAIQVETEEEVRYFI